MGKSIKLKICIFTGIVFTCILLATILSMSHIKRMVKYDLELLENAYIRAWDNSQKEYIEIEITETDKMEKFYYLLNETKVTEVDFLSNDALTKDYTYSITLAFQDNQHEYFYLEADATVSRYLNDMSEGYLRGCNEELLVYISNYVQTNLL